MLIRTEGDDINREAGFKFAVDEGEGAAKMTRYFHTEDEVRDYVASPTRAFFATRPQLKAGDAQHLQLMQDQLTEATPQEVRQSERRVAHFRHLFDGVLTPRVQVGAVPHAIWVTWEEFERMHTDYKLAALAGEHKNFPFQPLPAYHHKIMRPGKPPIRDIFQGECGVWTDRNGLGHIMLLKDQGPGDLGGKYHQVPDTITKDGANE
jgi:hypothetical protein